MTITTPTGETFSLLRSTDDGRYVLATWRTNREVYVLTHYGDGVFGSPRWECTMAHLEACAQVYADRFPVDLVAA